jgi:hypothetical protein
VINFGILIVQSPQTLGLKPGAQHQANNYFFLGIGVFYIRDHNYCLSAPTTAWPECGGKVSTQSGTTS